MALIFISSATASNSSSLSFTSGIDSTYDAYEFHFINMHPSNDTTLFQFQCNASGQTGFDEVITSTEFQAYRYESSGTRVLEYPVDFGIPAGQTQGTNYQSVARAVGFAADESLNGTLTLYNPSSTTFVKHFRGETSIYGTNVSSQLAWQYYAAGYINTTSAIDEIDFKFNSGTIQLGTIHLYGVK